MPLISRSLSRLPPLLLLLLWLLPLTAVPVLAAETSATLTAIRETGTLRIGVKADFPPFGMINAQGEPEGFEIDLARDVARRLGVTPRLVKVSTENRLQKLEQGAVDLVIATTADTAERRKIATAIEPAYYAGGVTLMVGPGQRVSDWGALRGKRVCATQGAYFNRPMSERYLLDLEVYRDTRDALLGLRDGRCVGYLYTNSAIDGFLAKEEWAGYQAPLPLALVAPWAMMIGRDEKGGEFERLLGDIVADWHRSGFLIEREQAWGIRPAQYLRDTRALWQARDEQGQFLCQREPDGDWPLGCREATLITAGEAEGLRNLGLKFKEWTGVDLSFLYDPFDRTRFLHGLGVTILMMLSCVLASLLLGLLWALVADSRWRWLGLGARALGIHARMTPPLLQMYLLFFGVGGVLFARLGVSLYPMAIAVWCMSYYTAGAIMNSLYEVANHQRQIQTSFRLSFHSLGMAVLLARGPILGSLINVMKQTVMASAIAVPELLSVSLAIMADKGNVTVMMNVLLLTYLLLISLAVTGLSRVQAWLDRRVANL